MSSLDSPLAGRPAGRIESAVPAALATVAALALLTWEVAGPTLPIPFELGIAARAPGTPAWALRVPMALTALAGMFAFYMFMARTADRVAAIYGVAVLATVPAWFVHGRTMTGAIVPIACSATVLAALGLAILDDRATPRRTLLGLGAAAAAATASVVAVRWGVPNRGLVTVAAVPAVAVGAASLSRRTKTSDFVLALGVALGAAGAVAAFLPGESWLADLLLGSRGAGAAKATFESPVAALAYGLVPWTPLVPLALLRRPTSRGHLALLVAAGLAIVAHAALAPRCGPAPFAGVAAIAGAIALTLRSQENVPRPASALVVTVLAVGWLVSHDVRLVPDRVLVAFGASDAAIPAAHAAASSLAVRSSIWLCTALASVALVVPRSWLPTGRGLAIASAGIFAGLVLRAHAYPALLLRLSPGAAFDAWAKSHRAGEPLGLVGVDPRSVVFAPGTAVVPQHDAPGAGRWLASAKHGVADEPRRFLALGAAELPRVNAEYRSAHGRNVPVLAGHGGAVLLAASALARDERSESPLDALVLDAPPSNLRPIGATLDGKLEAVGYQLVDDEGRVLEVLPRGSKTTHVRVAVRALETPASGAYCTFLHVDHTPSRFSAEHREHTYPMSLWRAGDVFVDDFVVPLPAHFRAGSYKMYWGVGVLPCEDDRRMHVTAGPNDGHDRVPAGTLEVR